MDPNTVKLIILSNEIFKRYNDMLEKQAQYENFVDEYGVKIIKKLVDNEIVEQEQANDIFESMRKSASVPIKLLDTVVSAIDAMNVKMASTSSRGAAIGYPYSQSRDSIRRYNDIDMSLVEDFVIDISQLR